MPKKQHSGERQECQPESAKIMEGQLKYLNYTMGEKGNKLLGSYERKIKVND